MLFRSDAIRAIGRKSLSWDFIGAWVPKLIATSTPAELIAFAENALDPFCDNAWNETDTRNW